MSDLNAIKEVVAVYEACVKTCKTHIPKLVSVERSETGLPKFVALIEVTAYA